MILVGKLCLCDRDWMHAVLLENNEGNTNYGAKKQHAMQQKERAAWW